LVYGQNDALGPDIEAGSGTICRASNSSSWEWDDGSCPFHWRWPSWYRERIRNGLPVHFKEKKPEGKVPQRDVKDPREKEKVVKKLDKV